MEKLTGVVGNLREYEAAFKAVTSESGRTALPCEASPLLAATAPSLRSHGGGAAASKVPQVRGVSSRAWWHPVCWWRAAERRTSQWCDS